MKLLIKTALVLIEFQREKKHSRWWHMFEAEH
jgi:hypothetical protein